VAVVAVAVRATPEESENAEVEMQYSATQQSLNVVDAQHLRLVTQSSVRGKLDVARHQQFVVKCGEGRQRQMVQRKMMDHGGLSWGWDASLGGGFCNWTQRSI
jgi:hypothetical protein